ncbi:MAG: DNA polymerase III subunit gamma/tau [Dysgonamonadaceae bacterium]|jgi:DNA polymerase-3 subunit gamma/tau|nr:DNA polymerase III subunit gamma/tau [Dysgonamonadaceae bacterium]
MDNYIVSARKYRPATFHSVVGQKSLTATLKNAIQNNKLAHAYLFCGPRGVGKTTCARIFAKTINCLNLNPDGEACNECESCRAFNENRSYNIYELDAASNNSVDDVRSLTDQVRIPPQIGRYKVYIIDEVHVLSNQAFNAFLKTLEEPPHYALFILATTEKHKIIPTILSRCQIYDFSRIGIDDIVENLEYIAKNENVTCEREALNTIARKADGGMRDALSIFDQAVSFSGGNITYQSVIENLNVLDYEYYFRLTEFLLAGDVPHSLLIFNEIMNKGFDGQQVTTGLAGFFRDVLVCKDPQTIVLFEVGDAVKEKYLNLSRQCTTDFLYKSLELSNECDLNYRYSKNRRLLVEILLIRLCQLNHPTPPVDDDKKKMTLKPVTEPEAPSTAPTPAPQPAPAQVATETPAPAAVKSRSKVSLKSPSADKSPDTVPEAGNSPAPVLEEPFTQEDLVKAWKEYADCCKEDAHLENTILNIVPQLQANGQVHIPVFHPDQQRKLTGKEAEISAFLSQKLRNNQLQLKIEITEDSKEYLPYTSRDKFAYMREKNPAVMTLVKDFNLTLD